MVIPRMEVVEVGAFEFFLALVEVLVFVFKLGSSVGVKREAEWVVVYTKNPQSPLFTLVPLGKNNDCP